jgi:hypothetical protein
MCIAILNNENNVIDFNTLQTCWNNNRDGAGMLYIQDGVLKTYKQMDSFNKFYDAYLKARNNDMSKKIVLHFRISTHGKVNKTNCHPFLVNQNLGFVHNGIICGVGYSKDFSDTYLFNKDVLKKMPIDFLQYDAIVKLLEGFIDYSKLIFLDKDNNSTIVNEARGVWDNGNWYSNTTYKDYGYYDVGGKSVLKAGVTPRSYDYDYYDSLKDSKPKIAATYSGGSYSRGITRSYSDNEDWEFPTIKNDYYEEDETCECCRTVADTTKFSSTYRIYTCHECWNEYISETEGTWDGKISSENVGV